MDYGLLTDQGEKLFTLLDTDWADWDAEGSLLFVRRQAFQLNKKSFSGNCDKPNEALKLIADIDDLKFEDNAALLKVIEW